MLQWKHTPKCYFLVYRSPFGRPIDWEHPTGGFIQEAKDVIKGIPIPDQEAMWETAYARYHVAPGEKLVLAEVFGDIEKQICESLSVEYEDEYRAFRELMGVGDV